MSCARTPSAEVRPPDHAAEHPQVVGEHRREIEAEQAGAGELRGGHRDPDRVHTARRLRRGTRRGRRPRPRAPGSAAGRHPQGIRRLAERRLRDRVEPLRARRPAALRAEHGCFRALHRVGGRLPGGQAPGEHGDPLRGHEGIGEAERDRIARPMPPAVIASSSPSRPGARASSRWPPTSGAMPIRTSGIASSLVSVTTRSSAWPVRPMPPPIVMPCMTPTTGTGEEPTAKSASYSRRR